MVVAETETKHKYPLPVRILFDRLKEYPHPGQEKILLAKYLFILVTGGDQGGKSWTAAILFFIRWLEDMAQRQPCEYPSLCNGHPDGTKCEATLLYWLVGADYMQTTKEFEYILNNLRIMGFNPDPSKNVNPGHINLFQVGPDGQTLLDKPILRIETKSATDNYQLSRDRPHGQIGCEAGMLDIRTYERMRGRTAPARGWMFLIGSIEKAQPWYPQLRRLWAHGFEDRISFMLPSPENLFLYPMGYNDPAILALKKDASDDWFMERIMGQDAPPEGLVFKDFSPDIHIRDVKYIPGEKVYLANDPGYGRSSAHAIVVYHRIDGQLQGFDEIYEQGLTTKEIITICKKREWWKEEKVLVSDPHYKDAHHSMGSVAEEWQKEASLYASGTKVQINHGTDRLKSIMKPDPINGRPGIVWSPECKGILSEYGAVPSPITGLFTPYRWRISSSGEIVGNTPHDEYNHSIKATIYLIVDLFGSWYRENAKAGKMSRRGGSRFSFARHKRDVEKLILGRK